MNKLFLKFKKCLVILTILAISTTCLHANSLFFGSWVDTESGDRVDILDGFKSGIGPILLIKNDGDVSLNEWKDADGKFTMSINYSSYDASKDKTGNLLLKPSYGDTIVYTPVETDEAQSAINLKDNETGFLAALGEFKWLTSINGKTAIFKKTFSNDSGVVEFRNGEELDSLLSFGISSGVIKIGSDIIIEARITDKYFIGVNERDNFFVFKSLEKSPARISTDLKEEREKFFDKLLTGEWQSKTWGGNRIHKFRPIKGELAGKQFITYDDKLSAYTDWEYSPATGAIKIGFVEYINALIVNDTLAYIDEKGDQTFLNRAENSSEKRYTLGDVKTTATNENSLDKIAKMLSPQLQNGNNLYSFEFGADGRTGFTHEWRSDVFDITGETFSSDYLGNSDKLYQVEDFIIFNDAMVFKMDSSPSRLRTKSNDEVKKDAAEQEKLQGSAQESEVIVRVMTTDGKIQDVVLPVSSFKEISSISLLTN
ncbi:hypothetical protein N9M89_01200 [Amylibacter sp.]|nr:hypothetical protein [Amylibacter sp.]